MKNLKKILALGLSATMVSSMFVAGAAYTDQADIKAIDAVNMLSALGVVNGYEDGAFKPEGIVTRAEMAKMIFVVRNNKADDTSYRNLPTKFTDIKGHWGAGYIKFCESQGIIAGKSATQFDPDSPVTGVEAAKMLLVLTGYTPEKAGLVGPMWITNTLRWAGEVGILEKVDTALDAGLPRQYAAQEIYNTLNAPRVKWSNDSGSFDYIVLGGTSNKETVGMRYMGLVKVPGTLTKINKDGFTLKQGSKDLSFIKVKTDYTSLLGQRVEVLTRDGKADQVFGVYATDDNTVYDALAANTKKDGDQLKIGDKTYDLNANIAKYVVGGKESSVTSAQLLKDVDAAQRTGAKYIFADTDADGKIDTLVQTDVKVGKVTYVSNSKIIANGKAYDKSKVAIADGIVVGDWVVETADPFKGVDAVKIDKADKMEGTVSGTKPGDFLIDGTWYKVAAGKEFTSIKAGNKAEAVIVNGVIFDMKRVSGTAAGVLTDVAVVVRKSDTISGKEVQLAFFDGTTKIVAVDPDNKLDPTVGQVYGYTVSNNKYTFSQPSNLADYYGDFTYSANKPAYEISDKAKVVVFAGNGSALSGEVKFITGKQYKNTTELKDKTGVAYFTSKVDGLTKVSALVVDVATLPAVAPSNDFYAYIVSSAYVSGSNKVTYDIWTGTEKVTVTEDHSATVDRAKNTLIGYGTLTEDKQIKDVKLYVDGDTNYGLAAIMGANDQKTRIVVQSFPAEPKTDGKELKIDGDTKVFYIDSDSATGMESGVIQAADDFTANQGGYAIAGKFANALVLTDGTDHVNVLVMDVQNKMVGAPVDRANAIVKGAEDVAADKATLATTFAQQNKGTQDAPYTKAITADLTKNVVVEGVFANLKTGVTVAPAADNATFTVAKSDNNLVLSPKGDQAITAGKALVKVTLSEATTVAEVYVELDLTQKQADAAATA